MNIELLQRISELEAIKLEESQLKEQRLDIEEKIISLVNNDDIEGSKTIKNDDVSVTVTNAVTRSCNFELLDELSLELPTDLHLIQYKPALDLKNLRVVEKTAGVNFKTRLADAITIKPRKSAVKFKRLDQ